MKKITWQRERAGGWKITSIRAKFNRIVWEGLAGNDTPYPAERSGIDLRENRKELLKKNSTEAEEALKKRGRR